MFHIKNKTPLVTLKETLSSLPPNEVVILPLASDLKFIINAVQEIRSDCFLRLTCGLENEKVIGAVKHLNRGVRLILGNLISLSTIRAALSNLKPDNILFYDENLAIFNPVDILKFLGRGVSIQLSPRLSERQRFEIVSNISPFTNLILQTELTPESIRGCLAAVPSLNTMIHLKLETYTSIHTALSSLKPNSNVKIDGNSPIEFLYPALQATHRSDLIYHLDEHLSPANRTRILLLLKSFTSQSNPVPPTAHQNTALTQAEMDSAHTLLSLFRPSVAKNDADSAPCAKRQLEKN